MSANPAASLRLMGLVGPSSVSVDWALLAPFLILALTASVLLLAAGGQGRRPSVQPFVLSLAGLAAALFSVLWLLRADRIQVSALGGMLVMDRSALYLMAVVLTAALLGVLLSRQYLERAPAPRSEYHALLLLAALGMGVMAATQNLLVLFVGLEIFSLALYVLVGITRTWIRSLEASLKYFLLGAFSTGFILYGFAFLYGATGSLDLMAMGQEIRHADPLSIPMIMLGLGLVLVGLSFKVAAVPFHWWAPDVYEGAPTPVTAFMAVGTKGVALMALVRVVTIAFGDSLVAQWSLVLGVLALLSMVMGNLVALTQRNVKRMLAYSSVAHAGYLLVAVAAGTDLGTSALLFYLASYLFTTLGAFGIVSLLSENGPEGEEGYGLLRYAGLGRSHPGLALAMAIFMLSLTGIPPTSGFTGKYFIFNAAMQQALPHTLGGVNLPGRPLFMVLALVGLLTSVVSAAYYLRVIVAMYMEKPSAPPLGIRATTSTGLVLGVAAAAILVLGLAPSPLYQFTLHVHAALQALAAIWPA